MKMARRENLEGSYGLSKECVSLPYQIRLSEPSSLGFYGGDTNLYRFVGDDPTSLTDPTGLQADSELKVTKAGGKYDLKGKERIRFDDGKTITIEIRTGVSYELNGKKTDNAIQFKVASNKKDVDEDFKPLNQDVHWLQLVYVELIDSDGKPIADSSRFIAFRAVFYCIA